MTDSMDNDELSMQYENGMEQLKSSSQLHTNFYFCIDNVINFCLNN